MNKNNDNKIRLTFHPAEFGAKMPIPLAEQSVKAGFPSPAQDYMYVFLATACRMQAFSTVT